MGMGYGQPPTAAFCPNCRTQLQPGERFCPACGQAATAPGWPLDGTIQAPAAGGAAWTDPAHPPYAPPYVPPAAPGAPTQTYPGQVPIAGVPLIAGQPWTPNAPTELAQGGMTTPVLPQPVLPQPLLAPPPKRRSRKLIAAISGVCLLALLLAATAYLYTTFAAQAQVGAARYLPSDTVAYLSVDLIAAATNGYHYDPRQLNNAHGPTSPDQIEQATGLNWQTDVLPWLGREVAFAMFPKPGSASASVPTLNPADRFATVFLLQSRDDGKAQAAVAKAASYQKQQGRTISQESYGGLTLYSVQPGDSNSASAFVAGKGWAVIASDAASAHTIVDRLTGASGSSGTLAESGAFQSAMKNLPSGRFGTLFVNAKSLVQTLPGASQASLPFVSSYPTAGGYLSWTSEGLRAQVTFVSNGSNGGAAVGDLSGDTTSLASDIPAHPVYYAGVANLGAALHAVGALSGASASSGADPAQSLFGVPATDPALQQPAAIAFGAANGAPTAELVMKAPDAAAVQSLLRSTAQAHDWTLKPATAGGHDVTAIYGAPGSWFLGAPTGSAALTSSGANAPDTAALLAGDEPAQVLAYAGTVNGVLVITSTAADFATVAQTAQGGQPSLATQDAFQSLVRQAPTGAASSAFVDLSSFGALVRGSAAASGLPAQLNAMLVTEVLNDQEAQTTVDMQLQH